MQGRTTCYNSSSTIFTCVGRIFLLYTQPCTYALCPVVLCVSVWCYFWLVLIVVQRWCFVRLSWQLSRAIDDLEITMLHWFVDWLICVSITYVNILNFLCCSAYTHSHRTYRIWSSYTYCHTVTSNSCCDTWVWFSDKQTRTFTFWL